MTIFPQRAKARGDRAVLPFVVLHDDGELVHEDLAEAVLNHLVDRKKIIDDPRTDRNEENALRESIREKNTLDSDIRSEVESENKFVCYAL